MEREFEAKGLISEKEFEHLIENLDIIEVREQQNTYLDTADQFFKSKDSALRLRIINDKYIFSLKRQDNDGATEWNDDISKEQLEQIINTKSIDLTSYDCPYNQTLTDLQIVTIITKRYVCKFEGSIIELDMTTFGDVTDYELEIESTNLEIAQRLMNNLVYHFDLDIKKSYPKIARYFMYN